MLSEMWIFGRSLSWMQRRFDEIQLEIISWRKDARLGLYVLLAILQKASNFCLLGKTVNFFSINRWIILTI